MTLGALQDAVVENILKDLRKQHWSLLKSGQRSGKTFISNQVVKSGEYKAVYVYRGDNILWDVQDIQVLRSTFDLYNYFATSKDPVLVVLDDPFWLENSYEIFEHLLNVGNTRVLVVGSRGPEFDEDIRWQVLPGRSYASWDLNPGITIQSLLDLMKVTEPEKVIRDFFSF